MNSASTLVATVSINYEDFTEGFLTCGTCLYAYDQAEHSPKLLSCSHTICQSCLELIAATPSLNSTTEAGCIRCPICRQSITIPSGGISALPPSFLVNQLFDLVNKKPREFIPKCTVHIDQEILFCETCDCVFCDTCDSESGPTQQKHIKETCTVIPFSTAIKRMSEILNYRSQQCASKLDEAKDNVQKEIEKLSTRCADATAEITQAFQKIKSTIDCRQSDLLEEVRKLHEYKKNILLEQLKTIESEKSTLSMNNSVKINNEADVKNLSKKISDLSDKNETALTLFTPRENCFICFEKVNTEGRDNISAIESSITEYGNLRTSKTYPPYCTSRLVHYATHLRSLVIVQSVDYNGCNQVYGGDPIHAELKLVNSNSNLNLNLNSSDNNNDNDVLVASDILIKDKRNGTYEVEFTPPFAGKYNLFIYIFNRPIKNCPLTFETSHHHNPIAIFGGKDKQQDSFDYFRQPASLAINKHNGRVYVLDSFNQRIKVLAQIDSVECPFSFMNHFQSPFFTRSCTGLGLSYCDSDCNREDDIQKLCLSPTKQQQNSSNPTLIVSDWRNKKLYELNTDGKLLKEIEHEDLQEPTTIAVDSRRRIFVVDRETIFVFNSLGKLLFRMIGCKNETKKVDNDDSDNSSIKKDLYYCNEEKEDNSANNENDMLLMNNNNNNINSGTNNITPKSFKGSKNNLSSISALMSSDKNNSNKSSTLSSLLSKRCKPKLNGGSLQRGSKVVMSAASRLKSTFTLSHSSSLVGAVSLQSMFSSNKHYNNSATNLAANNNSNNNNINNATIAVANTVNNYANSQYDAHSISQSLTTGSIIGNGNSVNLKSTCSALKRNARPLQNSASMYGSITSNQTNIFDAASKQTTPIYEKDEHSLDGITTTDETLEPFGIIRGIAIGPNDELIVACESSIRVLEPGDEYVYKRNIAQSKAGSQARLCGMTYDSESELLLCLYIDKSRSYIEIYDYYMGKSKFIIDSFDSKLIRPSSLATYGQHIIVTDLGNDCIKKYRFY